jgi:hypothetical protein
MLGAMILRAEEARVLGSLVEKELTTPQQYPLTIAALVAACNQASNRDPVVDYDEVTVRSALDDLKSQRLVRFVLPSHGRTAVRYRHILDETLALDVRQRALLGVLLLRGAQTIGELRLRTDRMAEFGGLDEVEHELGFLASLNDPLAANLGRRPGQKEERWAYPFLSSPEEASSDTSVAVQPDLALPSPDDSTSLKGRPVPDEALDELRRELTSLRGELNDLRDDLHALRASLGG